MPDAPTPPLADRVVAIGESATLAITTRANQLRAAGLPVIGFGAGQPDFPTPQSIVSAAQEAAADPANHGYTPSGGLPELREAIAYKTKRDSDYDILAEQVVVTNGGKHAIYSVCQTLLDPGDEVLLPSPYWVSYPEIVRLAGGTVVPIPTRAASGFQVTVAQLEAAVTARTKLLIFVSPSNPTGAVYPPDLVAEIGEWAAAAGIWVLTDEIYEHLVYGEAQHVSMPAVAPQVRGRCVVVNGVAKTYAMTGWRVGWMVAPQKVAKAAIRLQSHVTANVANVAQRAALTALTGDLEAVAEMRAAFGRRRNTMIAMFDEIESAKLLAPEGAFYAFPDVSKMLGRPLSDGSVAGSTAELADLALDRINVALVPGEAFGAPGHVRLSFAVGEDDIIEGMVRIGEWAAG